MAQSRWNLDWLTPALAVGGSFARGQAEALAHEHMIRAVVDLREEEAHDPDELQRRGIAYLHLPTPDHCAVAMPMLMRGVAFVGAHLDRGDRVLIHCAHGIGRGPSLALCVLVARGTPPIDALSLAKESRPSISPSPGQYEGWVEWLRSWQSAHAVAWEVPRFETFARIAYRHLAAVP